MLAALCLLALHGAPSAAVLIDNTVAKRNITGEIMDAHDGTINQWEEGGSWYFYAMGYGLVKQGGALCKAGIGYGYSWIGVWKSADLSDGSWELVREARDDSWPKWSGEGSDSGVYFRVHVVKNPKTGLYVLWVNADGAPQCPKGNVRSCWLVGTSATPEGPFTYVGASGSRFPDGGDFDILVDDDGAGYIMYTATTQGHRMSAERLSDDFLTSLGALDVTGGDGPTNVSTGYFGNEFVEAPAFFKRDGTYYALFGKCCCFCSFGSGIGVYTAPAPLGPWTYHYNIGCGGEEPRPGCGCGMQDQNVKDCPNLQGVATTKAQQNFVFPVKTADGTMQYIWTGDRWESSSDGYKGHDLQYWAPLSWVRDEESGLDLPQRLTWIDSFEIELASSKLVV
eukprot:TRINITY_DN45532_c0_g1_i1.p2 TRINITY_DN45532_c0_g1~~TRINITY_DN45532_c0_g1_i1.p2  ORF type:complete len:395 (+),score=73.52 TRINITY_DN45532_c0_g1_i1:71-1255(+)